MQHAHREAFKGPYPDRVLTIHNYFDGPLEGVATLDGLACIYECDAWENWENGDFTLFYLTPIDDATFDAIMAEWERWIEWMAVKQSAQGWKEQTTVNLAEMARQSGDYRRYTRRGKFHGSYEDFHSHIDKLYVDWSQP